MPEEPKTGQGDPCPADATCEKARELLSDWRKWLAEGFTQVETFTKEKPATGLALSFALGFVISSWFRRK
ncbi:MAG: hypothetical protein K8T20_01900 [Planctomycetes bacterium]|nr:hypothetical protein [Planctomycetota bacterium]